MPVSFLADLSDLRAQLERLRLENERLRQDNERLQRELAQAKAELDETRRASKRQAAPFAKGAAKAQPKTPGRKRGTAHGCHGHRPPPPPESVDEVLDAPLPDSCPHCGSSLQETLVAAQYQTEIPRRPLIRQFNVHVGSCCACGRRVQGRHPLQTSHAFGAAASQIGPDAQAAVATLNKTFGLSHGKVSAVLQTLFGVRLTRGASAGIVLRAADRLGPAQQEIREAVKASARLTPDETGWRVGGRPAWLHAWVTERATCYAIDQQRSACVLERLIGVDWSGRMTHDGMASYDRFTRATHQQCVGHVLRRVREMEATATRGAVHYPRKLIRLFTEAIHLRNRHLKGEVTAQQLQEAKTGFDRRLEEIGRAHV